MHMEGRIHLLSNIMHPWNLQNMYGTWFNGVNVRKYLAMIMGDQELFLFLFLKRIRFVPLPV